MKTKLKKKPPPTAKQVRADAKKLETIAKKMHAHADALDAARKAARKAKEASKARPRRANVSKIASKSPARRKMTSKPIRRRNPTLKVPAPTATPANDAKVVPMKGPRGGLKMSQEPPTRAQA